MTVVRNALLSGLAVLVTACATPRINTVDAEIRALEQQQVQAALTGDRKTLDRIFAPEFMLVNPAGAVSRKEDLLKMLAGGTPPYRSASFVTDTLRSYDKVVVSTGTETVIAASGAQAGQTVQRRITHVWERDKGAWRLVLRHATLVTPAR
jgi:uncharacterized protein (TIGR02246 family)